ncbi:MAG: ATP-dependent dethiobiotin synthetase BioD [Candidatus Binataceae bacterium]
MISGSGPGCGKTMVGCALAFAFKVRGMRVGVMKPVANGCHERDGVLVAEDAEALRAAASSEDALELISPCRYPSRVAPYADVEGVLPERARIEDAYVRISTHCEVMIVEETDSLAAPICPGWSYADLARGRGLELIVVAANRPGFIGATALVCGYAKCRRIPVRGFILNSLTLEASNNALANAEIVTRMVGVPCLGTVRFKEPLALAIVESLL